MNNLLLFLYFCCRMVKGFLQECWCGVRLRGLTGGLGWWWHGKPSVLLWVCGGWSGLETGCSQRLELQCTTVSWALFAHDAETILRFCLHLIFFLLQVYTEGLTPFAAFTRCFCKNSFASLPVYKKAIYQILEVVLNVLYYFIFCVVFHVPFIFILYSY